MKKARNTWVFAIVGLLGVNVAAAVTLAILATDGETQVIPAYYARASRYDSELDRASETHRLGWRVDATLVAGSLDVVVRDAAGALFDGARVHVTGYQRAHAADVIDGDLAGAGAGRYHASIEARAGWHDLTIDVERGGQTATQHLVVEAR